MKMFWRRGIWFWIILIFVLAIIVYLIVNALSTDVRLAPYQATPENEGDCVKHNEVCTIGGDSCCKDKYPEDRCCIVSTGPTVRKCATIWISCP